jgi:GNAT superfamily N-acetyltransferase
MRTYAGPQEESPPAMIAPYTIRPMTPADVTLALDWAAAEGWNPGHADAACFTAGDPEGFLIGEVDGEPAATISVVNYDPGFAFLGFYIVRPDLRGRGLGFRLWQAGIAHAGHRVIGLDGVVAQQDNYRKSGFAFAYNNIRYGGVPSGAGAAGDTVPLGDVPFAVVERDDATVFPAPRPAFLRAWIDAPGHVGRALMRNGKIAAWGIIRPCRTGFKIGPLVADDRDAAETVFAALVAETEGEIFLDVPQPNTEAKALAEAHSLSPVFETARMYTGPIRLLAVERVFGVTTFELG